MAVAEGERIAAGYTIHTVVALFHSALKPLEVSISHAGPCKQMKESKFTGSAAVKSHSTPEVWNRGRSIMC